MRAKKYLLKLDNFLKKCKFVLEGFMKRERGNGANVIVVSPTEEILVVRQNYKDKKWMLPGGEIERNETPKDAAQSEVHEESGLIVEIEMLHLIAYFVQRPNGIVFLYETNIFSGEIITTPTDEISEVKFMSISEILSSLESFGLGYSRMILRYLRCKQGIDPFPYEGRLSVPVEYLIDPTTEYLKLIKSI